MLKLSAAFSLLLVTTFQATRPLLRCCRDWNTRATVKGSLKLVDPVAPRPTCRVTRLRAATVVVGSKRVWNDGWSLGMDARLSAMKNRSNLPRSAMRAPASTIGQLQLLSAAPSILQPAE